MYKPIFILLLLSFSAYAQSQSVWTSASECDDWSNIIRNAPSKSGACSVLSDTISTLKKANSSANNQYCLSKFESLNYELCGVTASAKNSTKPTPTSKEQIYAFLYKSHRKEMETNLGTVRASSFNEALSRFNNSSAEGWALIRRLDDDKCKKGFYVLGINNIYRIPQGEWGFNPDQPIAGFMNCGYRSIDEAIDKGTKDFPIPFFQLIIGAVASKDGDSHEMVCHYDQDSRGWKNGARFGPSIQGDWGSTTPPCNKLNGRYPILVDREPQTTIWVTPR